MRLANIYTDEASDRVSPIKVVDLFVVPSHGIPLTAFVDLEWGRSADDNSRASAAFVIRFPAASDNDESPVMVVPSNGAHINGFAGDFVPKLLPDIVIVFPWDNVPLTEDTDGAAKSEAGVRSTITSNNIFIERPLIGNIYIEVLVDAACGTVRVRWGRVSSSCAIPVRTR